MFYFFLTSNFDSLFQSITTIKPTQTGVNDVYTVDFFYFEKIMLVILCTSMMDKTYI
jgi:hypothetical protein